MKYYGENNQLALNLAGLSADVAADVIRGETEKVGLVDAGVRNADEHDRLGPGAWYIFWEPR